jgi:signal transduction histidine kinase
LSQALKNFRLAFSLLLAAYCLFSFRATAQNENTQPTTLTTGLHQWGAVTLFHGLPSDRVRAIAEDAEGVMWFGTDGGLAKYDGRRTQRVAVEGLPTGRVLALKVDDEGLLWVGTEGGAARLVQGAFRLIEETGGKAITAIETRGAGRVVLASEQGLLFDCTVQRDGKLAVRAVPDKPLQSKDAEHPGPLSLTSLAAATGEALYAGTQSRGLLAFKGSEVKEVESRPRPFFINAVELDTGGTAWLGAKSRSDDSGLYRAVDISRPSKILADIGTVLALQSDAEGGMWVGTDERGAFYFKNERLLEHFTFEETAGGLRSDRIYTIMIDREGVVWFGTDKGVCRYDPHAPRVETVSTEAASNFVRTLFQTSGGRLLCGTNSGLFIYDRAALTWYPVKELARKIIYAIREEKDGRLLVGSASGLYASEKGAGSSGELKLARIGIEDEDASAAADSIRAITLFEGATYLASFGRGVERLEGTRRTLLWPTGPADAALREVVSLHADESGRLWIGTATSGLFYFDGREVKSEPALDQLNGSAVWAIDGQTDAALWLATGRGLYLYRAGQLRQLVPEMDARALLVSPSGSQPSVWCATAGGGLLKVAFDEQFGPLISRLDAEQGLPSQSIFALITQRAEGSAEDSLLIGTTRGLARYEPGRVQPALSATRIISRRMHQPDELRAGLRLEYPQNSLLLDVAAASSRTFPEQFQYGFLLYDEAGRIIKQKLSRDAQFAMEALRPGKYRVVARAFTSDLVASNPLAFEFQVAGAPFPRTIVALAVLLTLALIALLWGYWQNRRLARTGAQLMEANRQLADARLQVANQAELERRRIARDLHDQTLADLRHLLMLTDRLPAGDASDGEAALDPAAFRAEIESISQEVRRICEDLSPSVLENVGLAAALEWALANEVAHAAPDCKFEYEFACEEDLEERINFGPGVEMQIYRIVQEAVTNICRHAGAARVSLKLSSGPDASLILHLEDDGRDFDPQDKKKRQGRGLANIRARASLIEAEANWSRREGGGTLFTLSKPNALKDSETTRA